uniref:Non-structural maintenance of chromosomes element 1 homolog n=1 Tax=Rhizophora mucronata TaxID=61149 RepID=A0A2P2JCY1_RHIMU
MAGLNWKHHTLIQALMARGPLTEADFRNVFASVTGRNSGNFRFRISTKD